MPKKPTDDWTPFWFESNMFFTTIDGPETWLKLREAYPDFTDERLLSAREATYSGTRSLEERNAKPNFGFRSEHDGNRTLAGFFAFNNMELPPGGLGGDDGQMAVGGSPVDILNPEDAANLEIGLLASALARTPRFGGHTRNDLPAYNVAQHSVGVRILLREEGASPVLQMLGLLHDLSEAILVDIPRPLKLSPVFKMYRELEDRWQSRLYRGFVGDVPTDAEKHAIKRADNAMLEFEVRHFLDISTPELRKFWSDHGFNLEPERTDKVLEHFMPLGEHSSRVQFMTHYNELASLV